MKYFEPAINCYFKLCKISFILLGHFLYTARKLVQLPACVQTITDQPELMVILPSHNSRVASAGYGNVDFSVVIIGGCLVP